MSYSSEVLADGPYAFWEGEGNGNDSSGNSRSLTLSGPTYTTGLISDGGQAFSFDNSNDSASRASVAWGSRDITLEAAITLTSTDAVDVLFESSVDYNGQSGTANNSTFLVYTTATTVEIAMLGKATTTGEYDTATYARPSAGKHRWEIKFRRTQTGSNRIEFRVDDVLQTPSASSYKAVAAGGDDAFGTHTLFIGARNNASFFSGFTLDSLAIYGSTYSTTRGTAHQAAAFTVTYTDSCSGSLALTGSNTDAFTVTYTDSCSGSLALTGSNTDVYQNGLNYTDSASGSIGLSGSCEEYHRDELFPPGYWHDLMSDVDATLLTAHVPVPGGGSWAKKTGADYSGDMRIVGATGRLRASAAAQYPLHLASPSPAAGVATAYIDVLSLAPSATLLGACYVWVATRVQSAGDQMYLAVFSTNASGGTAYPEIHLYRKDAAGTYVGPLGTPTGPTGAIWTASQSAQDLWPGTIKVGLEASGSGATVTLDVYVNDVWVATTTDTSAGRITTDAKAGTLIYHTGTPTDSIGAQITRFDIPSVSVTGVNHLSDPSGTLTLSGSNADVYQSANNEDAPSGTLALTGSKTETWEFTDARSGTLTVAGDMAYLDGFPIFEPSVRQEFLEHAPSPTGTLTLTGSLSENYTAIGGTNYDDSASGSLPMTGSSAEPGLITVRPQGMAPGTAIGAYRRWEWRGPVAAKLNAGPGAVVQETVVGDDLTVTFLALPVGEYVAYAPSHPTKRLFFMVTE